MAEYSIEPWGEVRADLQSATIAALVATGFSGKPHTPAQFMPNFDTAAAAGGPPPADGKFHNRTAATQMTYLRAYTLAVGGTIHGDDR